MFLILKMMNKVLFILLFILVNQANAKPTVHTTKMIDLIDMDDEIYRQPSISYKKVMGLQSKITTMSESEYLWWLLRKAQTENLLHLYSDFSNTVIEAQALVKPATSSELTSLLNVYSGLKDRRAGKYIKSKEVLTKALDQAKQNNLFRIYVMGKQELAHTQALAGLFDVSLIDLQEAYIEAFALEDHFLLAVINETYGSIYVYMNEYEKSAEYYQKALNTYELLNYKAHIAEAIFGLATSYRYQKKYDLAIKYFKLYQQKIAFASNEKKSFLLLMV